MSSSSSQQNQALLQQLKTSTKAMHANLKSNSSETSPNATNQTKVQRSFNNATQTVQATNHQVATEARADVLSVDSSYFIDDSETRYDRESLMHWVGKIFIVELLATTFYMTIVTVGFRLVGNSLGFGLVQGGAFAAMCGIFWNEDFGYANPFIAADLCSMRQFRLKKYWLFLVHWSAQILGGFLAMAGVYVLTNDFPGSNTFGTPFPNSIISTGAAFFSEFVGSFLLFTLVLWSACFENQKHRFKRYEKCHEDGSKKSVGFVLSAKDEKPPSFLYTMGYGMAALSTVFYDLTGSSFNAFRWAIPRICMGNFSFGNKHVLYYLVAPFCANVLAAALAYLCCVCWKNKMDALGIENHHSRRDHRHDHHDRVEQDHRKSGNKAETTNCKKKQSNRVQK